MPFEHTDKKAGDLIRSADWNAMGTEVVRLGIDKISRAGTESLEGPLTVRGDLSVGAGTAGGTLSVKGPLTVGTPNFGAGIRVYRKQEDGSDPAHGALVLGSDDAANASLRLGYAAGYSWLQGQGQQALALNPRGGNVSIGASAPTSGAKLHVEGDAFVSGTLRFGSAVRQMVHLWSTLYGIGVQNSTAYLRTDGHFAFYKGGSHSDGTLNAGGGTVLMSILGTGNVGVGTSTPASALSVNGGASIGAGYATTAAPTGGLIVEGNVGIGINNPAARLHVAGGDLRLDSGREILFADNGQIRSLDNNHRILFRRSENKMEFREHGDIIFSSGASSGVETAKAVLAADGTFRAGAFRFGNASLLQADQGGSIELGGNNDTAGTGTPYIDFHYSGKKQDFNARIINDGDGSLSIRGTGVVTLECADFRIGHSSRRGSPARALVDNTRTLALNWDTDWPDGIIYWGNLNKVSTRDIKQDIAVLDGPEAAALLAELHPVRYRLRKNPDGGEHLGFIAEEVPDAVAGPDHRSINESHIVAVLTRVVKEQQRRLDLLTQRLNGGLSHA